MRRVSVAGQGGGGVRSRKSVIKIETENTATANTTDQKTQSHRIKLGPPIAIDATTDPKNSIMTITLHYFLHSQMSCISPYLSIFSHACQ